MERNLHKNSKGRDSESFQPGDQVQMWGEWHTWGGGAGSSTPSPPALGECPSTIKWQSVIYKLKVSLRFVSYSSQSLDPKGKVIMTSNL